MDSFDLLQIIQRPDEVQNLLYNASIVGLIFNEGDVNLGVHTEDELPYLEEVPIGYERDEVTDDQRRKLESTFTLKNVAPEDHSTNGVVQVIDFKILPENKPDCPEMSILYEETGAEINLKSEAIILKPGESISLVFRCLPPVGFSGYLGRWVMFAAEKQSQEQMSLSCHRQTSSLFLVGSRTRGCILDAASRAALSSDAPVFVPQTSQAYFNNPCPIFMMSLNHPVGLHVPKIFQMIMNVTRNMGTVPQGMSAGYMSHARSGKLTEFASMYNLNNKKAANRSIGEPVLDEKSNVWKGRVSNATIHEHWKSLGELLFMEETHMLYDIMRHDMHYVTIEFKESPKLQEFNLHNPQIAISMVKLHVRGSNESRPKISLGDTVHFRPVAEDLNTLYMQCGIQLPIFELHGIIIDFKLASEIVQIQLCISSPEFFGCTRERLNHFLSQLRYHVRFTFERSGFAFAHCALYELANDERLIRALFPCEEKQPNLQPENMSYAAAVADKTNDKNWIRTIEKNADNLARMTERLNGFNEEQRRAIEAIYTYPMRRDSVIRHPYLIFGPPGTGKTNTLIEAIVQVTHRYLKHRLLVTAPSDAAADVLCRRLAKQGVYKTSHLLRLNWWQRTIASVPPDLQKYCNPNKEGLFDIPAPSELASYKIVVCTCGVAGAINFDPTYARKPHLFHMVIIDEASQATEAESLIPLLRCKRDGKGLMVLAGDPQQLGPTLRSPVSKMWGQSMSLQERLLRCPDLYPKHNLITDFSTGRRLSNGHGSSPALNDAADHLVANISSGTVDATEKSNKDVDESMSVFLTKNYRSHGRILELPSKLFYRSSLEEYASKEITHHILGWENINQENPFPILFYGVDGQHFHEMDSPSFYNPSELTRIVEVCQQLIGSKNVSVDTRAIGVICAFRSQVLKVRKALRDVGLGAIDVGSVEDYQGQEKDIIIITTVLTARMPHYEVSGALGLVGDRRRFNVAVTRGRALCVIVGQPYLLYTDPCWREFLLFCHQNGGYRGCECSLLTRSESETLANKLDIAAHMEVLGSGYMNKDDRRFSLYTSESEWRTLL